MPMKTEKGLRARLGVGGGGRVPAPAIVGPLLGLVYVIVFPIVAIVAVVLAICLRLAHSLTAMWHKATQRGHVHIVK